MASATTPLEATDRPLAADLLERPVAGFGIAEPATLRSVLAESPGDDGTTLLVFLRHFG
jgi:hypothetical protein